LSNLLEPKFKKKDLDELEYSIIRDYAQNIINSSISNLTNIQNTYFINKKILDYENKIFNISSETNILLDNNINYDGFITTINEDAPLNLKWLKSLCCDKNQRKEQSFLFPIEKVVIVEGITEETLLPVFAKKCGFDFNQEGIQIVSAGGKNQVVKQYYTLADQLKIPIFVLLDNDAKENVEQIKLRLRTFDKVHLLSGGEFEDILPKNLILKTLNDYFRNLNSVDDDELENERMVLNLENIFKKKGFHEFKKSEFAQLIKMHIDSSCDISDEIRDIVREISADHSFLPQ